MKLFTALFVLSLSTASMANTFKIGNECFSKITKANDAIAKSFILNGTAGSTSVAIDKFGSIESDDGKAIVKGVVKVEQEGNFINLNSENTILPVGDGCYILNVSLER